MFIFANNKWSCLKYRFFSDFYMDKNSWISVALNRTVLDDEIKMLVDMSFDKK